LQAAQLFVRSQEAPSADGAFIGRPVVKPDRKFFLKRFGDAIH
jgi:hypothetical protein